MNYLTRRLRGATIIAAADSIPVWPAIRDLSGLSLKIALAQLAPMLTGLYLARLVAERGELLFSGYTLVNAVNTTLFVTTSSFLQSLYFVGGRALGRAEPERYHAAMIAGVALAIFLAAACAGVSASLGPMLMQLRMDPGLVAYAWPLGLASAVATLPTLLLVVHRVHAALQERAGLVLAMSIAGALLTAALSTSLLQSLALAPLDAALLTVWCSAGVNWLLLGIAWLSCITSGALRLPAGAVAANLPALGAPVREVAAVGWPIGAVVLLDSVAALISVLLVSYFWLSWVPLHTTVLLLVTLALIGPLGIAQAAVGRVAVLHAQGSTVQRNRVAAAALLLGLVYSILTLAVFALWPARLVGWILGPETLTASAPLLAPLMVLGAVLLALQSQIVIAAALLRGIGQIRAPLRLAFIGYMVVGGGSQLVLGLLLGHGLLGIWWGLLAGFATTTVAVLWRCRCEFRLPAPPHVAPAVAVDLALTTPPATKEIKA